MPWMIAWTWRPSQARHAPTQAIAPPLPDQAPARLPWATREALLQRTLADIERPAARRLLDVRV